MGNFYLNVISKPVGEQVMHLWHIFTEPPEAIQQPELRRKARLLSALLLLSIFAGIMAIILTDLQIGPIPPQFSNLVIRMAGAIVFMFAMAYGLNRTSNYTLAAVITVSTWAVGSIGVLIIVPDLTQLLGFPIFGVLLTSLFLSLRATILMLVATIAGIFTVPYFDTPTIVTAIFLVVNTGLLGMILARFRQQDLDQIEKQARSLAASEARYRGLFDHTLSGFALHEIVMDDEGLVEDYVFLEVNQAFEELTGLQAGRVIGKRATEAIPGIDADPFIEIYGRVALTGEPVRFEQFSTALGRHYEIAAFSPQRGQFATIFSDITERKQADAALQQTAEELRKTISELEQRNREATTLTELGDLLQACATADDAYLAITHSGRRLFPEHSGALYVYSQSRDDLEQQASWGEPNQWINPVFRPDECWALRRGRTHLVENTQGSLLCKHLSPTPPGNYLCTPLTAQGEVLGVLHVQKGISKEAEEAGLNSQLANATAEHLALALVNLNLRETLRLQSIRDPLTGLFNRRYMEEILAREIQRSIRSERSLAVLMMDLDHFKQFNDTYGHEAGDHVLRQVSKFFQDHIRGGDIACRYGGEEITLILPETPLEDAVGRAEELRVGVKELKVKHRGQNLEMVTISIGVSTFPQHGDSMDVLLRVADAALYEAKQAGRDRVMVGQDIGK